MSNEEIQQVAISEDVDVDWDNDNDVIPYEYSITSYGADYPVESLVGRLDRDDILIPHFQRDYVWNIKEASKFIETLLLGLPVPGIFLSKEKSGQFLVIDGQQRLRTLQFFYNGVFSPLGKEFRLQGVQERYQNKLYSELLDEDQRKLNDSIIHLTVVQQDEPSDDDSSIYHIFERLNTTGRPLYPQEIRACLYHGKFNDLLGGLNEYDNWRTLYGSKKNHKRMRDQELILRFFALYYKSPDYEKPMKGFLNKYMAYNRDLTHQNADTLQKLFFSIIDIILVNIGDKAFKPKSSLNAAVFDSIMVGVAHNLQNESLASASDIQKSYQILMGDDDFRLTWETATTDVDNVKKRIALAISAFAKK